MKEYLFSDLMFGLYLVAAMGLIVGKIYSWKQGERESLTGSIVIIILAALFSVIYIKIRPHIISTEWIVVVTSIDPIKFVTMLAFIPAAFGIIYTSKVSTIFYQVNRGSIVFFLFFIPVWITVAYSSVWPGIVISIISAIVLYSYCSFLRAKEKKEDKRIRKKLEKALKREMKGQ
jgi:hypothetical protein